MASSSYIHVVNGWKDQSRLRGEPMRIVVQVQVYRWPAAALSLYSYRNHGAE